ncbi:MAG: CCA tRNA nucleotidyltransferase [Atopostipes sp.]|nr:CCA tRNA nucleotidyltransferase [Atopostipes sp.]
MKRKLEIDGEFEKAYPVLKKIWEADFEAYYVGGSVRDRLLGLEVNDIDIATSALPEEIKEIFNRTVDVGIEHGTVLVLTSNREYEITTFRTESTYKDFRRPESVTFVRSLEEDLKRRDFTMNAIAMDEEGKLHDPYHGLTDIEKETIRAVGNPYERFNEDALRMMRAVRFAAQLDFQIEAETLDSIRENAALLEKIAVERIQIEFEKLLLSSWRAEGLEAMLETGLYYYCPNLPSRKEALEALIQDKLVFKDPESAWAMLIYQIDKNEKGFKERKFLVHWKLSNKMIQQAQTLFTALKKRVVSSTLDSLEIFNLGKDTALKVENLMEHLGKESKKEEVKEIYKSLLIKNKNQLAISGHDLMKVSPVKAGPWLGTALNEALRAVVYKKVSNEKEIIINYLKEIDKIPGLV